MKNDKITLRLKSRDVDLVFEGDVEASVEHNWVKIIQYNTKTIYLKTKTIYLYPGENVKELIFENRTPESEEKKTE